MFASPIPHTTRSPKPQEVNGRDFIFVSRAEMERKSLIISYNKRYNEHLPQTWCMFGKDLCLGDILNNNNILSPGGIKNKQFIEHMEYRGHLYGTTFEAVEEVPQSSNQSHWRNEIVN